MAAPSKPYTDAIGAEICRRIEQGQTVRAIGADPAMPCAAQIYDWLRENPSFVEQYARAREESAHASADLIADVAADVIADRIAPDAGRVAIDAHKWLAGKRKPKVYSEKHIMQGDAENPVALEIRWRSGN